MVGGPYLHKLINLKNPFHVRTSVFKEIYAIDFSCQYWVTHTKTAVYEFFQYSDDSKLVGVM